MQPIASPVSFNTIAHVVSLWKYVRIISRLSSSDLCAGHPARGPTSGSEAYLKSASHPTLANGEVKFFLFPSDYINVLHFIYYVHLPQPVGKDKYTFVHLLKEFPYPALDALPMIHILRNFLLKTII